MISADPQGRPPCHHTYKEFCVQVINELEGVVQMSLRVLPHKPKAGKRQAHLRPIEKMAGDLES